MSSIKERIFGAVTVMSEEDAQKVWDLILSTFALDNIEQVVPDPDEQAIMNAYKNGDPDYQPSVSQEICLRIEFKIQGKKFLTKCREPFFCLNFYLCFFKILVCSGAMTSLSVP